MKVTTYPIAGAAQPLRAALVADFHNGDPAPLLAALREISPDVILVAGDTVHDADRAARGLALLRSLITVAPVFCSLGNHEWRCENIEARIRKTGVRLLDNTYARLGGFVIGGLSSGYRGKRQGRLKRTPAPDVAWLDGFSAEKGTHILLCHHPEYYRPYLASRKMELVLSGHAHGGQWSIGGQGVFAPGQGILPRFTAGAYRGRKRVKDSPLTMADEPLLIVSRGLSNEIGIPRFGNPEEIVILEFFK